MKASESTASRVYGNAAGYWGQLVIIPSVCDRVYRIGADSLLATIVNLEMCCLTNKHDRLTSEN